MDVARARWGAGAAAGKEVAASPEMREREREGGRARGERMRERELGVRPCGALNAGTAHTQSLAIEYKRLKVCN